MTASDARPPSDTEATGWHMPKGETADDLRWYATHEALSRHSIFDVLQHVADLMETRTLVDPAEARETIARTLAEHYPVGYRCGETCGHNLNSPEGWAAHVTGLVLAALGGREQP